MTCSQISRSTGSQNDRILDAFVLESPTSAGVTARKAARKIVCSRALSGRDRRRAAKVARRGRLRRRELDGVAHGGHFAALEQPELLAADVAASFRCFDKTEEVKGEFKFRLNRAHCTRNTLIFTDSFSPKWKSDEVPQAGILCSWRARLNNDNDWGKYWRQALLKARSQKA